MLPEAMGNCTQRKLRKLRNHSQSFDVKKSTSRLLWSMGLKLKVWHSEPQRGNQYEWQNTLKKLDNYSGG